MQNRQCWLQTFTQLLTLFNGNFLDNEFLCSCVCCCCCYCLPFSNFLVVNHNDIVYETSKVLNGPSFFKLEQTCQNLIKHVQSGSILSKLVLTCLIFIGHSRVVFKLMCVTRCSICLSCQYYLSSWDWIAFSFF